MMRKDTQETFWGLKWHIKDNSESDLREVWKITHSKPQIESFLNYNGEKSHVSHVLISLQ